MISVVEYNHQHDAEWDAFVISNSRNGGIFHERNFLSYHPAERFNDKSLLFYDEEGELLGVLPAAMVSENDKTKIVSHPGSSAGGIIYERLAGLRKVLGMVDAAVLHYQSEGVSALELRLAEPIFADPGDAELSYSLWNLGFKITTREISSCVNLSSEDNWLEMGRKKNIFDVRKLQKLGSKVALGNVEDAYRIIENNLDNRYSKRPTHSLDELLDLKNRYPERVDPWLISLNEDIMATVVVFRVNKHAVHTFYIAQDYNFSKLQPMTTFFYELFDNYKNLGYQWFNFGISSRGELIKWGILEFKERVGGRATYRENWLLDNVQEYTPYVFN